MQKQEIYDQILRRNQAWVAQALSLDPAYFQKMGADQAPFLLYFGCSDSRIPIHSLTGTAVGDIFIHRNVANQFRPDDPSAYATLEYALTVLKIRQVVVCGHESCGGIQGAIQDTTLPHVSRWIAPIVALRKENAGMLDALGSLSEKQTCLAKLNIHQQIDTIRKSDIYQSLSDAEKPQLHGWFFEITTGKLTVID
jgi:carbonic anhydrase